MSNDWNWIITYESLEGGLGQVAVAGHIDLDAFRAAYRQWLLTDGREHVDDDWQDIGELGDLTPRHGYLFYRCGAPPPDHAPKEAWCTSDKCELEVPGDTIDCARCDLCEGECLHIHIKAQPPTEGKSWPVTYVSVSQP